MSRNIEHHSMKIAVTGTRGFPDIQGGVETHCQNLYPALTDMGCDVSVFTRPPYADPNKVKYQDVRLIPVPSIKNKFLEAFIHTGRSVFRARKLHPDIVHIHAIGPSFFALFAKLRGSKVVVTHHGPDYKRAKWPAPAKWFLRMCEWVGMKSADQVIVIDQGIAEHVKKNFGRRSTVIPNGVHVHSRVTTHGVLDRFGLKPNQYLLGVGRLVPEKGFHDLIEAYRRIGGEASGLKLVIAGGADHKDDYASKLQKTASECAGVVLTGVLSRDEVTELYSHARLFVLPSYYEGLPLVLLEAMSYGLPYLVSDIEGTRNVELLKDRYFKPGDPEALAAKLNEYVERPLSTEQKAAQISLILSKYEWDMIARMTLDVYRHVLSPSQTAK